MLQYSQIPEFLKTVTRSTFERNIPWKMSGFFRTKNGFKQCILSQIELITTCLTFKLELEIPFLLFSFTQVHID